MYGLRVSSLLKDEIAYSQCQVKSDLAFLNEGASHILPRANDQSNPWTGTARQPAHPNALLGLRNFRYEERDQKSADNRRYPNVAHCASGY